MITGFTNQDVGQLDIAVNTVRFLECKKVSAVNSVGPSLSCPLGEERLSQSRCRMAFPWQIPSIFHHAAAQVSGENPKIRILCAQLIESMKLSRRFSLVERDLDEERLGAVEPLVAGKISP